ncbi:MAG: hypothetical protein MMC23_002349 [Stictis urceolatum]|nr:hypothetical protein [Stictis urceolata]
MATAASLTKAALPILKTPVTESPLLPSELPRSPLSALGGAIKQEEDNMKTPITPPTAYTDFLKALSPAVSTPLTATSMRSSFSFSDRTGHLTPITQPSSAGSNCSCNSLQEEQKRKLPAATSAPLVPPTPFVKPAPTCRPSARTPTTLKKLRIPDSPTSVVSPSPHTATPRSATPRSATPRSATPRSATPRSTTNLRSPFSPTSWYIDGRTKMFGAPPLSAGASRHVSVKQVVTRTVTYTSKPLDPAPRGKRRKLE